eukprot:TRINITY_DN53955_c0_g1_i1.p1 TRINITY_DN53955_c0_g1~~TRINITY_DN53955_c0_g1_i1.p1  ORF type:complete len:259 (-),score=26.94 TRINITY_DN53955_c0_g1_i1:251-1027(-)
MPLGSARTLRSLWLLGLALLHPRSGVFGKTASGFPLCSMSNPMAYSVGEPVMLCFFVSTSPPRKMVFRLKVDEYATISLKGSKSIAAAESQSVYTWVAAGYAGEASPLDCSNASDVGARGDIVSCPQIYTSSRHSAAMLNLVVNLQDGKITGFAWDNNCAGCGPSSCMKTHTSLNLSTNIPGGSLFDAGVCGRELAKCSQATENSCDMTAMVTWVGTDQNGRNLLSAGMRLSKFTGYTLKSLFETLDDTYDKYSKKLG